MLDSNTNIGQAGYGAGGEANNQPIPMTTPPLYSANGYTTGIAIDVDAVAPAGTYTWMRIYSPIKPGVTQVDAIQVLPPTAVPPTAVPPTAVPPTAVPPTAVPPTAVPPTAVPPTAVPPTAVPPTAVPPTPTPIRISGRVFEDANYSGGTGSAFGAGDAALANVAVELYKGGSMLASTTTDAQGTYTFDLAQADSYVVRVVSASIGDADTPPAAGFKAGFSSAQAEQTYERDGVAGNGGPGARGGNDPLVNDFATSVGAGIGDTNVVVVVNGDVTGVDFGFSYNLIVNTRNAGQGSLRQFLLNANAINGQNDALFNIPISDPDFTGGVASIRLNSSLPTITDDKTMVDGSTQTSNVGNSNPSGPEIMLDGSQAGAGGIGLTVQSSRSLIAELDIRNFVGANGAAVLIDGGSDVVVEDNLITNNGDTSTPESGGIVLKNTTSARIRNNVLKANGQGGIQLLGVAKSNTIQSNIVSGSNEHGIVVHGDDNTVASNIVSGSGSVGIVVYDANNRITTNTVSGNSGNGVQLMDGSVGTLVQGNTIHSNRGQFSPSASGILCAGVCQTTSIVNNVIYNNRDDGITILGASNVRITRNSISDNDKLGIDLGGDGVTANDGAIDSARPNAGMDSPVITAATFGSGTLTVQGYVGSAANQALFANTRVEIFQSNGDPSGYGEGPNYLGFVTTDGNGNFSQSFAANALKVGDKLTATATDAAGDTSEFGVNVVVVEP